ncbi:uncharacterized protein ELE39_000394 [Cryptosporidium sp. chipmunk genotype I]|uniref:uncharacterized protein n=1 Tax=Cryptosporidium sp. chipmunk genotype I TaxID=1280935 RepID=UPI00351A184D|nr:hypothetical protein ELE39_000394 [Cryptosporidium sp. chipmunk genotype I]
MDAQDNQFFRSKPSTRIHHPPGGASSFGIGFSAFSDTCDSSNINRKETNRNIDATDYNAKNNINIENNSFNLNQNNPEVIDVNNTDNHSVGKTPTDSFKTNVKVHNPPGGKSTFSLY